VIWRKLSFGTKSPQGSRFVATILTVVETCRQQSRNVFEYLTTAMEAHFANQPGPSLLPRAWTVTLQDCIREKVSDTRVLRLVELFLQQGVMDGLASWTPEEGTPQGAVISPLLANIYLNPLDHLMAGHGYQMVRYADDFVILCRTQEDAERALEMVRTWVEDNGLTLHPTKTRIADARTDGFAFLGYEFRGGLRLPRIKSRQKLKDTVRAKTKRTNGTSLNCIIGSLNQTLRGWFTYFRHCHGNVFRDLDGYIRGRLRSILRKRAGRRGRGRGSDHQRWPNRFFAEHGLYSLEASHCSYSQPCLR
jgi:RNA-directed DNA polymerase